jgi:hypothetical protein
VLHSESLLELKGANDVSWTGSPGSAMLLPRAVYDPSVLVSITVLKYPRETMEEEGLSLAHGF